jgi:hypothetical protein
MHVLCKILTKCWIARKMQEGAWSAGKGGLDAVNK